MSNSFERHVQNTLRNYHDLSQRRYSYADFGASDVIIDIEQAIYEAGLTEREAEMLDFLYNDELTQAVVSERMGVSQQRVEQLNVAAIKKIAVYYTYTKEVEHVDDHKETEYIRIQ